MKNRMPIPISRAAVALLFLIVQSGCESQGPKPSPSVTRERTFLQQGAGAQRLGGDHAKEVVSALAKIPVACPSDRRYRLPGFAMQCLACHPVQLPPNSPPEAYARRKSEMCAANLEYLGLAARTWASNYDGVLPFSFAIIANEIRSPWIIVCPAQTNRHPSNPWEKVDPTTKWLEATYQIVSPWKRTRGARETYVRCPIHNLELLANGDVTVGALSGQ